MARWEPDARGRLLRSALELFDEQGYDATTAAEIAARAGLTKTTLFRHFADKREILFQGQSALVEIVTSGVESAAVDASALEMMRAGIFALCDWHVIEQQEIGRRIGRLVALNPELQERTAFKRSVLTAALEAALLARIEDGQLAGVLADLGIRAYYNGFNAWIDLRRADSPSELVLGELERAQVALQSTFPVPQSHGA